MKVIDILKSALANLMRNKTRTILTMIAIFIGAFTIALVGGLNVGVNAFMDEMLESAGGEDMLVIFPEAMTGFGMGSEPALYNPQAPIEGMDIEAISAVGGIQEVERIVNLSVDYITNENRERYILPITTIPGSFTIQLEVGAQLDQKSNGFEILLAPEYVEVLGFSSYEDALGEVVNIAVSNAFAQRQIVEVTVVGVREPSFVNNGVTLANDALATEIHRINEEGLPEAMQGQVLSVQARLDLNLTEEEMDGLREELLALGYIGQTLEDQVGMVAGVINAITGVLIMFAAISLLAASFGIINTLYMSVGERTREIGLMKAMGLSRFKVFATFSWEATLIGFFGSLFGILGAMGAGSLINQVANDTFLEGLPSMTLIQFSIPVVVVIMLLIMLIAFLAGTLPARRASKLDPITALRTE